MRRTQSSRATRQSTPATPRRSSLAPLDHSRSTPSRPCPRLLRHAGHLNKHRHPHALLGPVLHPSVVWQGGSHSAEAARDQPTLRGHLEHPPGKVEHDEQPATSRIRAFASMRFGDDEVCSHRIVCAESRPTRPQPPNTVLLHTRPPPPARRCTSTRRPR